METVANISANNEKLDRKIERWKSELLDTGKRNRMINFRDTKRSTLRILEPESEELFNRLAFSSKALTFQKPISKNSDIRTYSIIALMETLSYNLNVQVGDLRTEGTVVEREKTLKNLRAKAKLAQEEQGTNILYLCFGFLHWRESTRESAPWIKSPLLLMPVTIGLKSLNAPYTLSRDDDDIELNPTLSYLFSTGYNIELPAFTLKDRDSIGKYFTMVEEIIDSRGWKVERSASLGLMSFLKISMYHDLNNNREKLERHPVIRAMAGDLSGIQNFPEEAVHFDLDSVKPGEWHEVMDADSSQEEAILLSRLGVSFVMQGPPGTGKSQTITNLIAEAMMEGKKVLFVSEKAAALEVVLKRLEKVGLSDFCLAVHNYKAKRKEILDSIGANLNLTEEPVDRYALRELTELFHDRTFLNAYAKELHEPLAPLNQSIYEVFGRLAGLQGATEVSFSLNKPGDFSRDQYASVEYSLSAFEKALLCMGGKLSEHPWYGTKATSANQIYWKEFLAGTKGLSEELRKMNQLLTSAQELLGLTGNRCLSDARWILRVCEGIVQSHTQLNRKWFEKGAVSKAAEMLAKAKNHAERLELYKDQISKDWTASILNSKEKMEEAQCFLDTAFSGIWEGKENDIAEERLEKQKETAVGLDSRMEKILSAYRDGLSMISFSGKDTTGDLRRFARCLKRTVEAPYMKEGWFDIRKSADLFRLVDETASHDQTLHQLLREVSEKWDETVFSMDADAMLRRFKTEYTGLFRCFRPDYKEDMQILKTYYKPVKGRLTRAIILDLFSKILAIRNERKWFADYTDILEQVAGEFYHGEMTDWCTLRDSMSLIREMTEEFPADGIPQETISALLSVHDSQRRTAKAQKIAEIVSEASINQLEKEIESCHFIADFTQETDLTQEIRPRIRSFLDDCDSWIQYVKELASVKKNKVLRCADIRVLLANAVNLREEETWFVEQKPFLDEFLGSSYKGNASDWNEIRRGIDAAERLNEMFGNSVPETVIEVACGEKQTRDSLETDARELKSLTEQVKKKLLYFQNQFDKGILGDGQGKAGEQEEEVLEKLDFVQVADHYDACLNGFDDLNRWLDYLETKAECDKLGLSDFTAQIVKADNTIPDVVNAFEKGFCAQWLEEKLAQVPAVNAFRRRVHEQKVERFIRLDEKQCEIARQTIRRRIISEYPRLHEAAKEGTELGILRHEMEKKRNIMQLRKLFQSIPNVLLTLKPCLMMSPLSVAYFLDADLYQFDLVIFDEASQIFPQDAIGAIFRGKQVVIAGDTRQLPPTNFFASSTGSSTEGYDSDEGYEDEVYDSILEETASILPNRTLLWHYRSRHEHLIAFSNREIYRNELITFPGSNESEPDTGVEYVYVEDGYYEPTPRNCNILEARRIVELVKEHIEKHPDRSLGVIAFSEKQQQAISLEIQRFRERNMEYDHFFAEGKEEEFFVKNLENVQGDERDTILFSIGYARTREQKASGRSMSMRFGPLDAAGGERRLNVAITRARINVKLVGSILPSDMDMSRTESEGIRMLRSYIEYAMKGDSALAGENRRSKPDEFVDYIAQFIRENGYTVRQYVGNSAYKIDIAVKHPSETIEQFIAAVECDGFSYVSAKTARDRDRLRGSVLKQMGWNLYRVWSAEWYQNPEVEGKKLLKFLESAVQSCDERTKAKEMENRIQKENIIRMLERIRAKQASAGSSDARHRKR